MTVHVLKSWPKQFEAALSGAKRHELRNADRNFEVGDHIQLREYDPETKKYSGRNLFAAILYITDVNNQCALSPEGLNSGYCILSIAVLAADK